MKLTPDTYSKSGMMRKKVWFCIWLGMALMLCSITTTAMAKVMNSKGNGEHPPRVHGQKSTAPTTAPPLKATPWRKQRSCSICSSQTKNNGIIYGK